MSGVFYFFKLEMQIFVRTLSGKMISLNVEAYSTVGDVRLEILRLEGIPANQQTFIFAGRQLADENTLAQHNVQKDSTLFLVLRLRGQGHSASVIKVAALFPREILVTGTNMTKVVDAFGEVPFEEIPWDGGSSAHLILSRPGVGLLHVCDSYGNSVCVNHHPTIIYIYCNGINISIFVGLSVPLTQIRDTLLGAVVSHCTKSIVGNNTELLFIPWERSIVCVRLSSGRLHRILTDDDLLHTCATNEFEIVEDFEFVVSKRIRE